MSLKKRNYKYSKKKTTLDHLGDNIHVEIGRKKIMITYYPIEHILTSM